MVVCSALAATADVPALLLQRRRGVESAAVSAKVSAEACSRASTACHLPVAAPLSLARLRLSPPPQLPPPPLPSPAALPRKVAGS